MSDTTEDTRVQHQTIEEAFKPAKDLLSSGRLPDTTETRSAIRNLNIAEALVHEARDRQRPE
jgi:hypothetical protein